jgi:glutathione synthase/RimK-type ligase-like ATP-grasp enzyme
LAKQNIQVLNHPELIRWNADKRYLRDFAAANINIPDTVWLEAGETADVGKICVQHKWKNAVVKPVVSASAHGTELRDNGSVQGPIMVQRYLSAIVTRGEWSLMYFGAEFSHAVLKKPRTADFRVQKDFGGSAETSSPHQKVIDFAQKALGVLPYPAAFARVDLVEQDDKIYLMEMEVIEPELFLEYAAGSEHRLARALTSSLNTGRQRPTV